MTKKTSAKAPAKKAKARSKKAPAKVVGVEAVVEEAPITLAPEPDNTLKLQLSHSLLKKINEQAEEEGLSPEELVVELLSEAVVVRAWEIVERRITMRQGSNGKPQHVSGNGNGNGNGNGGQRGGRRHNNRRGGMSNSRYQNIMDDRASFLEYVRNQERQGR